MRFAIFALNLILACPLWAFEIENRAYFGSDQHQSKLSILSTADIDFFEPIINDFLKTHPDISIDYTVASSAEVMKAIFIENQYFDLVISSAMDLQVKLANDGFAQKHFPNLNTSLPKWAAWNNMVFAFTQEPAAIVVSKTIFPHIPPPHNRQNLINILRQNAGHLKNRLGTYDVRKSGLGYLFATQDARTSETYWRLTEVMGQLETKLYCCSSDMIDDVVSGKIDLAYNVLGSYAQNHPQRNQYEIILPDDMITVMLRTMFIPKRSLKPKLSGEFLDHVLNLAFSTDKAVALTNNNLKFEDSNAINRIEMGPGLLVFLDQFKKRKFLVEWENAIVQKKK